MIAYSRTGSAPGIELHTRYSNETDLEIAGLFDAAVDAYQLNLIPSILRDNLSFSDHYPFWQNGYPGILAIEDWSDHTPFYHTTNDRLSTLNMDFYTEFAKAALATYAHMGCLLQGRLAGTVRDSANGMPVPGAVVTVQAEGDAPWVASTLADGSYQLPLYAGDYTVTISANGYQETRPVETQILHDTTTTLDFDLLAPWTSFIYLPLIGKGVP
jgi:hypothetical protein